MPESRTTAHFLESLAIKGRTTFTLADLQAATGTPEVNIRASLRFYRKKGAIATPLSGFHVVVPPPYRSLGCLPADQFVPQLMAHLGSPYHVGLLSAAEYHGAAHQRSQVYQVMIPRSRATIRCNGVAVEFFSKRSVETAPTMTFNTPWAQIQVSTPEVTAFDLIGYEQRCGGLDRIATVLIELAEKLDGADLAQVAGSVPVTWAQRLGYMIEELGADVDLVPLARYVSNRARDRTPLSTSWEGAVGRPDRRWKVDVNVVLEPDL